MKHKGQEDLISVIVPVYNVEDYLPRCLDCIAGQTYRNLDIILVDDGSTDSSGAICDEFAVKDRRARVIHQPNKGLWAARNAGHDVARGDYLFFPDSDDYFHLETLRILYDAINCGNKYNLAICRMTKTETVDVDISSEIQVFLTEKNRDELYDNLFRESSEDQFSIFMWNKLFRRSLIEDFRSNDYIRTQDKDYMIRLFLKTDKAILVENRLYCWFQRPDSLIHSDSDRYLHYMCRTRICYSNHLSLPEEGRCYDHYLLEELYTKMLFWRESSLARPESQKVFSECRSITDDTWKDFIRCKEIRLGRRIVCLSLMRLPTLARFVMRITGNSAA